MRRARRRGIVVLVGLLPALGVWAPACVTNLSYVPTTPEAGPDLPDLAAPIEEANGCGLLVSVAEIDFGPIPQGPSVARTLSVKNLSTTVADVVAEVTTRFGVQPPSLTLAPGQTGGLEVTARADIKNFFSGTLTLKQRSDGGGGECPTVVNLRAVGQDRGRVIGPLPVDLGAASCAGPPPTSKKLSITSVNFENGSFTASVPSPFDVTPKSGTIAASGDVPLDVSSAVLAGKAGPVVQTLSLSITDSEGTKVTPVDVKALALGANLVFATNTLLFDGPGTQIVVLENTGNEGVTVQFAAGASGYKITGPAGDSSIELEAPPSPKAKVNVTIQAYAQAPAVTTLNVSQIEGGTLCAFGGLTLRKND